jgi:hypothetical protein
MRGKIADIWAEEAQALMPVARPFDGVVEYTKHVFANLARPSGAQSLQRPWVICQQAGEPALAPSLCPLSAPDHLLTRANGASDLRPIFLLTRRPRIVSKAAMACRRLPP